MKWLSSLLILRLLGANFDRARDTLLVTEESGDGGLPETDGGVLDAPFSLDAGVLPVVTAVSAYDGASLPAGWWLSDPKMQALGAHVVELTNERNTLQAQVDQLQSQSPLVGYVRAALIGVAVGCGVGVAGTLYVQGKSR